MLCLACCVHMTTITLISAFYFFAIRCRTDLIPAILDRLMATSGQGHQNYVHLLARNANTAGATISIISRNAKQDIIPALKLWLLEHPEDHGVASNLALTSWPAEKYSEIFGAELAAQILELNASSTSTSVSTSQRGSRAGTASNNSAAVTAETGSLIPVDMVQTIVANAVATALAAQKASAPAAEQPVESQATEPSFEDMLLAQGQVDEEVIITRV